MTEATLWSACIHDILFRQHLIHTEVPVCWAQCAYQAESNAAADHKEKLGAAPSFSCALSGNSPASSLYKWSQPRHMMPNALLVVTCIVLILFLINNQCTWEKLTQWFPWQQNVMRKLNFLLAPESSQILWSSHLPTCLFLSVWHTPKKKCISKLFRYHYQTKH